MPKIIINRKGEYRNRLRAIKVLIDGSEAGKIKNDSSEEFVVEPGAHTVQCKIDWCACQPLQIDLKEGDVKVLKLKSGMKYYNIFASIMILMIGGGFIYKQTSRHSLPDWFNYAEVGFCGFILLYIAYYLSIGRNNYLSLTKDHSSIFNN